MSSTQKRGFRLPWATEHGPDDVAVAATLDPAGDETTGVERDDIGDGPFRLADDARSLTTDAAPAATDVPASAPEAAMIDIDSPTSESTEAPPATDTQSTDPPAGGDEAGSTESGAWPATDRAGADTRPPIRVNGESRLPRRDNPLVAGLVKAMREAAVASRDETTARLEAEAQARVEAIRARATDEAAGLRKRADEDVSAIREWSKAEIARVKQETDERIEARRTELAAENERHAAGVDRLVEEVQTTVAAFEAEMDEFFKRLLAEGDPARLATLAEQAPDPPDLRGEGPSATDFAEGAGEDASTTSTEPEPADGLQAAAAAEAEAEATEGLDPAAAESWPTAALATARRMDPVTSPADANGPDATRLFVSGLTSVAGISAFKGALGQLAGVRSVSVSSGETGVFVFAVNHDPGVDLDSGVSGLDGFAAQVTDATNDGFTVVAREPAA
ncbi:MAG TPA: hypothetical protein VMQ65_00880 [Candidatus Limnocylindria bacterium]|nr:hypothetical protein [Candidatus Limnocylindria bacterium]